MVYVFSGVPDVLGSLWRFARLTRRNLGNDKAASMLIGTGRVLRDPSLIQPVCKQRLSLRLSMYVYMSSFMSVIF